VRPPKAWDRLLYWTGRMSGPEFIRTVIIVALIGFAAGVVVTILAGIAG